MSLLIDDGGQKLFLKNLLSWYRKNGRHDMPWRKTKDPYAIIVSEFMLQQTTVGTVRPYYARFLKRFPTLKSLANSDLNDVLSMWSGLGYYARARNLWAAMKTIQSKYKGKIPTSQNDLQELPGIGLYTSGAISSLAFNKPAVVLDGNIIRVLMRLLAIDDEPRLKAVQALLRKVVFDLTKVSRRSLSKWSGPKHVVLALMDLGSTICIPRAPKCGECPAASLCLARQFGKQEDIPVKSESADRPVMRRLYAVIEKGGSFLLGRRPAKGLFGGLWEFIGTDIGSGVEPVPFLEEAVAREIGAPAQVVQALPGFDHQLTHRSMLIRPFKCELLGPAGKLPSKGHNYERLQWIPRAKTSRLGVSTITRRILLVAGEAEPQSGAEPTIPPAKRPDPD